MLKYTIAGMVAAFALLAVGFVILAEFNEGGAEAGPAPVVPVRLDASGPKPSHLEIAKGRIVMLRLVNETDGLHGLTLDSTDVEQFQLETLPGDKHPASLPVPNIRLYVGAHLSGDALVRFKRGGTYELLVQQAGAPETRYTVTVVVD